MYIYIYLYQKLKNKFNMQEGTMHNGRYKKLEKLGDGSQGTVFKVEDLHEKDGKQKMYYILRVTV